MKNKKIATRMSPEIKKRTKIKKNEGFKQLQNGTIGFANKSSVTAFYLPLRYKYRSSLRGRKRAADGGRRQIIIAEILCGGENWLK